MANLSCQIVLNFYSSNLTSQLNTKVIKSNEPRVFIQIFH